ncbi:MAG: oligosaccharide flippase family protein [Butyricicoccus sp.]
MKEKKNYMHGALWLLFSGLVVKILGALFKIPLTNLIGDSGMGLFSFAMQFFSILFVISAAGIPVAESCLVSESLALGDGKQARNLVWITTLLFTIASMVLATGLAWKADWLASVFGEPEAAWCLVAIAPAVVLVTAEAGLRGWYQGTGNMEPTSMSQMLEATGKLLFGLLLARAAMEHGYGVPSAAAGAVLGVTIGELIAVLYLMWSVRHSILSTLFSPQRFPIAVFRRLIALMIPVTLGSAVMAISGFLDMTLIYRRLPLTGMTAQQITSAYGAYTGMALTLYHLPQAFSGAISVSILPAVSSAWTKKNETACRRLISSAIRLTTMVSIPCGTVLTCFAQPILTVLFPHQTEAIATALPLLRCLGFAEVFVGLSAVTTSVLQSLGRPDITVSTTTVGCVLKCFVSFFWMANPEIGLMAAPLSTILCFAVILVLNLGAIYCNMKWVPEWIRPVLRCSAASVFMVLIGLSVYQAVELVNGIWYALMASATCMVLVYALALIFFRGLRAEDVSLLPCGDRLARRLKLPE